MCSIARLRRPFAARVVFLFVDVAARLARAARSPSAGDRRGPCRRRPAGDPRVGLPSSIDALLDLVDRGVDLADRAVLVPLHVGLAGRSSNPRAARRSVSAWRYAGCVAARPAEAGGGDRRRPSSHRAMPSLMYVRTAHVDVTDRAVRAGRSRTPLSSSSLTSRRAFSTSSSELLQAIAPHAAGVDRRVILDRACRRRSRRCLISLIAASISRIARFSSHFTATPAGRCEVRPRAARRSVSAWRYAGCLSGAAATTTVRPDGGGGRWWRRAATVAVPVQPPTNKAASRVHESFDVVVRQRRCTRAPTASELSRVAPSMCIEPRRGAMPDDASPRDRHAMRSRLCETSRRGASLDCSSASHLHGGSAQRTNPRWLRGNVAEPDGRAAHHSAQLRRRCRARSARRSRTSRARWARSSSTSRRSSG